ncbi:hypothetical protein R70006_05019 [Paraburkholderia domus]|uniref:hypothetical protein n=1 Tax=Paraburkholderia domus TaxID=2793075 RepID=UPI001912B9F6|nr:hypothetical protein [Paraburkholderia domus]MBK5051744.1 hypothetical protein [Burkholderia sp. R-70006]CAE6794752.1 hypothetical protein R70006_05019 [Paraburkholderia domus]
MLVLSWQEKRRRLVSALAKLDAQIASRIDTLEESWVAKYRLSPHEAGSTQPEADSTPTTPTAVAKPVPAPAPQTAEAVPYVPDYLL